MFQWNRKVILNRTKDYYRNSKERLRDQAKVFIYKNLSEEDKNKKREYGKKQISYVHRKKNRLKEYQKKLLQGKKVSI